MSYHQMSPAVLPMSTSEKVAYNDAVRKGYAACYEAGFNAAMNRVQSFLEYRPETEEMTDTPYRKILEALSEQDVRSAVSEGTVVLDFYAPWCRPCASLDPVIREVSAKYPDVKVLKVNVDVLSGIASEYGVRSLPTLVLVKTDGTKKSLVGAVSVGAVAAMFAAA